MIEEKWLLFVGCWCRVRNAWKRLPRQCLSSHSLKVHSCCCSQVIGAQCNAVSSESDYSDIALYFDVVLQSIKVIVEVLYFF